MTLGSKDRGQLDSMQAVERDRQAANLDLFNYIVCILLYSLQFLDWKRLWLEDAKGFESGLDGTQVP